MLYLLIFLIILLAAGLSIRYPWWKRKKEGLLVLRFVHVGNPPAGSGKKNWIPAETFAARLDILEKKGYTTLTFEALQKILNGKGVLPPKPALITFDGGFKDVYQNAYPVLKEKKMKASVFLAQESVGFYNLWDEPSKEVWQDIMTEEQVKEILKSGVFDYGSHGLAYADLAAAGAERAEYEIKESKFRLENTFGRPCLAFAAPDGKGGGKINSFINGAGYKMCFSLKRGVNVFPLNAAEEFKRVTVSRYDDKLVFLLKISGG